MARMPPRGPRGGAIAADFRLELAIRNGYQLALDLRRQGGHSLLKLIALTGWAQAEARNPRPLRGL